MPSARGSTNWNFGAGESTTRCMLNDYQVSLASANSASAASMKCAGTGICDNVDAQKESSGIQGKKVTLKSKAPHL